MSTIPDEAVFAVLKARFEDFDPDFAKAVGGHVGVPLGVLMSEVRDELSAAIPFLGVGAWAVGPHNRGGEGLALPLKLNIRERAEKLAEASGGEAVPVRVVEVEVTR